MISYGRILDWFGADAPRRAYKVIGIAAVLLIMLVVIL